MINNKKGFLKLVIAITIMFAFSTNAQADNFEITITNITKAQSFTPILAVSHRPSADVFEVGTAASTGLETLAEEGNVTPLRTTLDAISGVTGTMNGAGLLDAGATTTIILPAGNGNRISLAAMLIPTNDAFVALDSVRAPRGKQTVTYYANAYDSGTEINDELCASIPGPSFTECGGAGGGASVTGGEEGFVHVHSGIQGIGDLSAASRDFNGPVAKITITRVR